MKVIVAEMLRHPFATVMIIGSIGALIANIIAASKGIPGTPVVSITSNK